MTSAAKSKGNSWERELVEFLDKTFEGNFQRVPNSGAFTGGSNAFRKESLTTKQTRMFKGDIIPDDKMPKLVIECKFYKDFAFNLLYKREMKQIDQWIQQTLDCVDPGDVWFLCMKFNRKGSFVLFDDIHKDRFELGNHTVYNNYIFTELEPFMTTNREKLLEITK